MRDTQNTIFNSYVFNDNLFPANNFNVTCNMIIYINLIIYILRSDRREFSNLLRNSIVSCIADLEGSPDRDYSIFCIDSLYHTALRNLRFDEAFLAFSEEHPSNAFRTA